MNKLLVLLFCFIAFSKLTVAQDTIITMEGERIVAKSITINQTSNECFYVKLNDSEKEIDFEDIFSVRDTLGKETIYYKQDSLKGYYYTSEEMKQYVEGMFAAQKKYKSPLTTVGGGVLSVSAVAFVVATGIGGLFWTPLVPVAYTGFVLKSKPSVQKIANSLPENLRTDKYLTGYVTQVKKRRVNNAIFGSIGGLVLGCLGYFVVSSVQ